MCVGRILEALSVVSDSKILVMFVTLDGEDVAKNISERHQT
jgi:hypothetical protein